MNDPVEVKAICCDCGKEIVAKNPVAAAALADAAERGVEGLRCTACWRKMPAFDKGRAVERKMADYRTF